MTTSATTRVTSRSSTCPNSAYDLVVMHFVLHDIPAVERKGVMKALARLLKPAGRLVLREPQGEGLKQEEIIMLTIAAGLFPKSFRAFTKSP